MTIILPLIGTFDGISKTSFFCVMRLFFILSSFALPFISISCQSGDRYENSAMTSMTLLTTLSDTLNNPSLFETAFLDSVMVMLNTIEVPDEQLPQLSGAYRDLGWRNVDQNRFGIALIAFDKAVTTAQTPEAWGELIESHLAIGSLFSRFDNYDHAQEHIMQAIQLAEKSTDLGLFLRTVHEMAKNEFQFKNFKGAEKYARLGIAQAKDSQSKEVLNLSNVLGLSLLQQGRVEEAKSAFEQAISIDSNLHQGKHGFLYGNLASCYAKEGKPDEAIQYLDTDLKLSLKDGAFHSAYGAALTLSETYFSENRPMDALNAFQIADSIRLVHQLKDQSTNSSLLLVNILRALNKKDKQLDALEKYTIRQEKWIAIKNKANKEQIAALISLNNAIRTIEMLEENQIRTRRFNILLIISITTLVFAFSLIFIISKKRAAETKRLSELTLESQNQQLQLLKAEQDLKEKRIKLQEIASLQREQELVLLRSRNEHQALAKEYYNDLKKKLLQSLFAILEEKSQTVEGLKKKIEMALIELNLLETKPFFQTISQSDDGADFIEKLAKMYPELSSEELKLSAYLRLNMSTKEIAQLKSITIAGVNKSRNRLRRKFGLLPDQNLNDFLMQIN